MTRRRLPLTVDEHNGVLGYSDIYINGVKVPRREPPSIYEDVTLRSDRPNLLILSPGQPAELRITPRAYIADYELELSQTTLVARLKVRNTYRNKVNVMVGFETAQAIRCCDRNAQQGEPGSFSVR